MIWSWMMLLALPSTRARKERPKPIWESCGNRHRAHRHHWDHWMLTPTIISCILWMVVPLSWPCSSCFIIVSPAMTIFLFWNKCTSIATPRYSMPSSGVFFRLDIGAGTLTTNTYSRLYSRFACCDEKLVKIELIYSRYIRGLCSRQHKFPFYLVLGTGSKFMHIRWKFHVYVIQCILNGRRESLWL